MNTSPETTLGIPGTRRLWRHWVALTACTILSAGIASLPAAAQYSPVLNGEKIVYHVLPAPPRPTATTQRASTDGSNTVRATGSSKNLAAAKPTKPPPVTTVTNYPGAPGSDPARKTLVLYDNVGEWAWLGEAYAVMAGQLASHGSSYRLLPAASYASGDMLNYSGVIYIGSYYDTPLPPSFLDDVLAGSRPVLWMNYNIWQLEARAGGATSFAALYGWSPQLIDTTSDTSTVTYKGVALKRDPLAIPAGLLPTQVTDPTIATVVATAGALPWATRSRNLMYIGEVPFSYVGPDDRYLAAADLISVVSNPALPDRKRALVRIEDVGADADPGELRAIADYLKSRNVPFSVAVIPLFADPNGVYSGGVPVRVRLSQAPEVVSALKYMQSKGGTLLMHGYTHQYSNVANPYSGVSADDFEFYTAHIDDRNYVIYDGPVGEDSAKWAGNRIAAGFKEFAAAGLTKPTIFELPHYAASAIDYQAIRKQFTTRYDRGLYAKNWCPAGNCGTSKPDYTRIYGQYFPYLVSDIFGSIVIPESIGNVELEWSNNNPPRFPADLLATAHRNSVVRDGVISFFIHPYLPIANLKQVVEGIQASGRTFVSAAVVASGN